MSKLSKKQTSIILLIAIIGVLVFSAIGTGVYFAVSTIPAEGSVVDSSTNNPISGVVVSDGKNVTKTNDDGKFKLKGWNKGEFVTITVPGNYNATDDRYYIALSKDIKSYDFKLDKVDIDRTQHTFLQITDTEINATSNVDGWLNGVKETVEREKPAFIVHTGDICYIEGLNRHKTVMNTENMGVPVRYVIGNHDYVKYGSYGEQLFEEVYGPTWYSFDVGNVHYIVSPMMTYTDVPSRYSKAAFATWLENDLKQVDDNKKIVMFNHDTFEGNGYVIKGGSKTIELKKEGLIAWVYGHWHYNLVNNNDGVLDISTSSTSGGGIDSSPSAIRSVTITDNQVSDIHLSYIGTLLRESNDEFLWQSALKGRALYSEPILSGDFVYVATMSDSYPAQAEVAKININSGNIVWSYTPKNSVRNSMALAEGKLVFQDAEGIVTCLDATNGNKLWDKDLNLSKLRYTTSAITIDNNKVYCGNANSINALDLNNGEIIWSKSNSRGEGSPNRFIVHENKLIVGAHWNTYFAYDTANGKQLWKSEAGGIYTTATPYIANDKMVLATNSEIYEININNGKINSNTKFERYNFNTASTPLVEGDIFYYSTANRGIVAINMQTKTVVWEYSTAQSMIYTSPYTNTTATTVEGSVVSYGENLVFGASDGYIHVISKNTGEMIKKIDIGSPILTKVVISGNTGIVIDFEGRVTAFNL